jgi:hypothetical protein
MMVWGAVAHSTSGKRDPDDFSLVKNPLVFGKNCPRQKLSALMAEFAFGKIYGVTVRAEITHPLSTFVAKFDTRGILVSTSRAFHGKLLSKAAEL